MFLHNSLKREREIFNNCVNFYKICTTFKQYYYVSMHIYIHITVRIYKPCAEQRLDSRRLPSTYSKPNAT